jgi:hypothetical protein
MDEDGEISSQNSASFFLSLDSLETKIANIIELSAGEHIKAEDLNVMAARIARLVALEPPSMTRSSPLASQSSRHLCGSRL